MHALYLIKKSGLPKEIKEALVGGEAGNKDYADYANLNDVYGVTSNLKVYYCKNGLDSIMGLAKENLDKDNPDRVVFDKSSPFAGLFGDGENVTIDDVKTIDDLSLDSSSGITSLKDIYNLPNLKELVLDAVQLDNLDGIQNCAQLNYVYFKNYSDENITINDYSKLSGVKNLEFLYILNSSNKQMNDLCEGIKDAEFSKLHNLRIMGIYEYNGMDLNFGKNRLVNKSQSNLSDISGLSKLSSVTKGAITTLFLNNNKIEDISSLDGFNGLDTLFIPYCNLKSLKGLKGSTKLKNLYAYENKLGFNETEELDSDIDSLVDLSGNTSLYYLDLIDNSNLKNVSYLSNCSGLKYLYLSGCSEISFDEIAKLINIFDGCIDYSYDQKYSLTLTSENATRLDLADLEIQASEFLALERCKKLIYLNLKGTKFYQNGTKTLLQTEEINELLNKVVSNFTLLKSLSLNGQNNLTDGRFLAELKALKVLDVYGCGIITGTTNSIGEKTGLENINNITTLRALNVNTVGTDLSKIQPAISRLNNQSLDNSESLWGSGISCGFSCNNSTVIKTLESCDEITAFYYKPRAVSGQTRNLNNPSLSLDLSECKKLKKVEFEDLIISRVTLPSSIEYLLMRQSGSCIFDFALDENGNSKLNNADFRYATGVQASETMKNLGKCKNLVTLLLLDGDDFLKEIGSLSGNDNLRIIDFEGANWHSPYYVYNNLNNLSLLSELQELEKIKLGYIGNDNLNFLSSFTRLTEISIINSGVSDISSLSEIQSLSRIAITNSKVSDLSALSGLKSLAYLQLESNSIANILPLANLKNLETLYLENNLIGDNFSGQSNIDVLVGLNPKNGGKLKNLKLNGNLITNYDKLKALSWNERGGF